jgi:hypothetical protein
MEMTVAARRRLLLDIARRRAQPGTGGASVFLEQRSAMVRWPDLTPTLAGIPWAAVGAVAPGRICPSGRRRTSTYSWLPPTGERSGRANAAGVGLLKREIMRREKSDADR